MQELAAIHQAVGPVLGGLGLSLYDVEFTGTGRARVVRITIEKASGSDTATMGSRAVSIDDLTDATRALDPIVEPLVNGAFSLEVSSPGLERTLRLPAHFIGAIGETISVKFRDASGAVQRVRVQLLAANAANITILDDAGSTTDLAFDAITAAHTVFNWGPAPKPGTAKSGTSKSGTSKSRTPKSDASESGTPKSGATAKAARTQATAPTSANASQRASANASRTKETTQS